MAIKYEMAAITSPLSLKDLALRTHLAHELLKADPLNETNEASLNAYYIHARKPHHEGGRSFLGLKLPALGSRERADRSGCLFSADRITFDTHPHFDPLQIMLAPYVFFDVRGVMGDRHWAAQARWFLAQIPEEHRLDEDCGKLRNTAFLDVQRDPQFAPALPLAFALWVDTQAAKLAQNEGMFACAAFENSLGAARCMTDDGRLALCTMLVKKYIHEGFEAIPPHLRLLTVIALLESGHNKMEISALHSKLPADDRTEIAVFYSNFYHDAPYLLLKRLDSWGTPIYNFNRHVVAHQIADMANVFSSIENPVVQCMLLSDFLGGNNIPGLTTWKSLCFIYKFRKEMRDNHAAMWGESVEHLFAHSLALNHCAKKAWKKRTPGERLARIPGYIASVPVIIVGAIMKKLTGDSLGLTASLLDIVDLATSAPVAIQAAPRLLRRKKKAEGLEMLGKHIQIHPSLFRATPKVVHNPHLV